jgi:hypothetical protein
MSRSNLPGNERQAGTGDKSWRALFQAPDATVFWTLAVLGAVMLISLGVIVAVAGKRSGGPLMSAFAALMAGGGIGFLFGIPKILQSDRAPESDGTTAEAQRTITYRQQVNTNLTEISDWLTKIIVGLGLINLKEIPEYLDRTARNLSRGITPESIAASVPFATGVLICFTVLGFLFGYLSTRLVLQSAFSRADQEAAARRSAREDVAEVRAQVEQLRTNMELFRASQPVTDDIKASAAFADPSLEGPDERRSAQQGPLESLRRMAEEYADIDHPSKAERLRLKDLSGARMAEFALVNGIPKDQITAEANGAAVEGMVLTLALLVIRSPETSDVDRLLRVSDRTARWHVQYRVVSAFMQLLRADLVRPDQNAPIHRVLRLYRVKADDQLKRLIGHAEVLVAQPRSGDEPERS